MNRSKPAVKTRPSLRIASATLLALLPSLTMAGTAVVQSGDGGEAMFEYRGDMLRIGMGDGQSYAIVRDGTIYAVSVEDGQTMVIDAGSVMRGFASAATAVAPSDLDAEVLSMDKTSRKETVAGIVGEVYEVRFRDDNGQERKAEIVLSDDPLAIEFRDALFGMMNVATEIASEKAQAQGEDMRERLDELNAGVLRYENELVLTRISGESVDAARFELPAEPMNLQGLGSMLGAMSAETNGAETGGEDTEAQGNLFSNMVGALGGKVERQTDRAGDTVENEVDRETDEAVDKGIKKALGKLFGN